MPYLPSLRLSFPGGAFNDYRLHENQIEFRKGDGMWRILGEADLQLHFVLHTEVAKWLQRETANAGSRRKLRKTGAPVATICSR
jgi:hypothetical protein